MTEEQKKELSEIQGDLVNLNSFAKLLSYEMFDEVEFKKHSDTYTTVCYLVSIYISKLNERVEKLYNEV